MSARGSYPLMSLVVLGAFIVPSCRTGPPVARPPESGGQTRLHPDVTVQPLRPGVWVHTSMHPGGVSSNGLVLVQPSGLMLVDTACTEAQTEAVMSWAERTFSRPWLGVVVTHWHDYRVGGAAAVRRRGVAIEALDLTAAAMAARGLGSASVVMTASERRRADHRGFEVFYPGAGHTRDNVVVWLPDSKVLFGGCLVKDGRARHIGNVADADLQTWPTAIRNLQENYPQLEIVVPGHGQPGGPEALTNTLALLATGAWPELQTAIHAIAAREHGLVGVAVEHVESGRRASLHGGDRFVMASVYKLPIALALLDAADRGQLSLAETRVVTERDEVPGVTRLWQGQDVTLSLDQLLEAMVGGSNNTAADLLLARLGGTAAVEIYLERLGLRGSIRVDRTHRQRVASAAEPLPAGVPDERDTAAPNAMATLLVALAKGKLLSPSSRERLLAIMAASTVFPNRLRGLLPPGTRVAHKTGTWPGTAVNDVGLVTLPDGGRLAIAVFLAGSKRAADQQARTIAEIARAAYDLASLAGGSTKPSK